MYNFDCSFTFSHPYGCSPSPCLSSTDGVAAEIPCGPSTLLMGQRSPWCANEQEARSSGIQHNKDLTGSTFQAQHSISVSGKQLQSEGGLEPGRQRPHWAGSWFMQSIKLALNWCWAFLNPKLHFGVVTADGHWSCVHAFHLLKY